MKLGYSDKEARHIFIGEYIDQYEVYKKYHDMEILKVPFSEAEKEEDATIGEENPPQWVIDAEKGRN